MLCPYCRQEMEPGWIESPYELAWLPGRDRSQPIHAALHENAVVLSPASLFKGSAVAACLCRSCHKILIDYPTYSVGKRR